MTELTWTGKYRDGKKVAPVRIALPFQTIETVNESAADREKRLGSLFSDKTDTGTWTNRLIWGDKKYVLPSLLPEFAGKVDLIYIDPPFNVKEWWDARLEGDRSKVWACPLAKPRGPAFHCKSAPGLPDLRAFRSNPSRVMHRHKGIGTLALRPVIQ